MTCVLCSDVLTIDCWFTYDSSGPFCESCFDFYQGYRSWIMACLQHDKAIGQLTMPWAYSLRGIKKPIDRDGEEEE